MSTDFRSRDGAPLTEAEWQAVDTAAQDSARAHLIGRRFLSLYGPLGAGVEYVEADRVRGAAAATVSLLGEEEDPPPPITTSRRSPLALPLIYRDARLYWRDLERARQTGATVDVSGIVAAAAEVAMAEDNLIFRGDARLGIEGILGAADIQIQPLQGWTAPGDAFAQVVAASQLLLKAGHPGPYTLVLSPELFARLERVNDLTGTLEIAAVERLVRGAVLPSPAVTGAVLLDASSANLDLVVGADLTVAYADSELMNHRLRVLETAVVRIKRPTAIVYLRP